MDDSMIQRIITILFVCCIGIYLVRFLYINFRGRKQSKQPVEIDRATVHYKHPDPEYVPGAQSIHDTSSGYIYHITFHTDSGRILKLYMNAKPYFSIEENAVGQLTWQGNRYWDFVPEKNDTK